MEIKRNGIEDVLAGLPEIEPFAGDWAPDLFLTTLGFEDRTSAGIEACQQAQILNKAGLGLIIYPTNIKENHENLGRFDAAAQTMNSYAKIKYSKSPSMTKFRSDIRELLDGKKRVIFDISTCSSYIFFPVMAEIVDSDIELRILYTEACDYYPLESEWNGVKSEEDKEQGLFKHGFEKAEFQSTGVDDVHNCGRATEMNPGNYPSSLVIIPNFNPLRVLSIVRRDSDINRTASQHMRWIIGVPPAEKNSWRVQALITTSHLEEGDKNVYRASTSRYKDIIQVLEGIWQECRYERYMTIGSLGSKMQHLGTEIFLLLHTDVGLWVSEPTAFKASNYSTGIGSMHQVHFGCMKNLRELIRSYMKFICLKEAIH